MTKAASKDKDHKEIYLATENTEILLTLIDTVFARLAFFGKTFFPKRASSKGRCLVRECFRPSLLSQVKDTDLRKENSEGIGSGIISSLVAGRSYLVLRIACVAGNLDVNWCLFAMLHI